MNDIMTFARTLYGEARGEGLAGIEAVASVIINRLKIAKCKGNFWWGKSITEICLKPYQFSCWNKNDINYTIINAVNESDAILALCKRVAVRAQNGTLKDQTGGATHYHHKDINPEWANKMMLLNQIANHIFYKELP